MTNVKLSIKGTKLTIEVELSEDHGPSKSGKTTVVATTHGLQPIADEKGNMFLASVNIVKK